MILNIVNALRINSGGGLVYFSFLHNEIDKKNNFVFLDYRIKNNLKKFKYARTVYVKNNLSGWFLILFFRSKFYIRNLIDSKLFNKSKILSEFCINGYPPFIRFPFIKSKISILCQNKLIFAYDIKYFSFFQKVKYLYFYRILFFLFLKNTDNLIVQTQTMKKIVEDNLKNQNVYLEDKFWRNLKINNFFNGLKNPENKNIKGIEIPISNFIESQLTFFYPSAFYPYKNHKNLIYAFKEISEIFGNKIKLILTLSKEDLPSSMKSFNFLFFTGKVNIFDIHAIYQRVDYLIFPSLLESLGLPLIEANLYDLPIICSRRDYVFDVCEPLLTFNPENIEEIKESLREAVKNKLTSKEF